MGSMLSSFVFAIIRPNDHNTTIVIIFETSAAHLSPFSFSTISYLSDCFSVFSLFAQESIKIEHRGAVVALLISALVYII